MLCNHWNPSNTSPWSHELSRSQCCVWKYQETPLSIDFFSENTLTRCSLRNTHPVETLHSAKPYHSLSSWTTMVWHKNKFFIQRVGSKVTAGRITGLQQCRRDGCLIISSSHTEMQPPRSKGWTGRFYSTSFRIVSSRRGDKKKKIHSLTDFQSRNNGGAI